MPWLQGYPYYLLMGSMLSLYMGIRCLRCRKTPGRRYLWILMLIISFVFAATAAEIISSSFTAKLWWRNVQQIPLFSSTLFTYAVVKDYVARPAEGLLRKLKWYSIPVLLDILLIFTDSYHHLMRSHVGVATVAGISGITVQPTLLSMLFIAYDQLFGLFAVVLLATSLVSASKHYFRQNLIMLMGLLIPIFFVFFLPILKIKIAGFTALVFLPATVTFYFTIFRDPQTTIYPLIKHKIVENMKDGIILTDAFDTIIDINDAGEMMLSEITGLHPDSWIGRSIDPLVEYQLDIGYHYTQRNEGQFEIEPGESTGIYYGVSLISTERTNTKATGMLIVFSDQTEKKRYERELVHQATVDDLTGLYNRRHFMRMVNSEGRGKSGKALLLIDIDDFKLINDTYGHIAGDRALISFSQKVLHTYKDKCIAGRVGGEEFALCFFVNDEATALREAEKFRATMGEHVVELNEGQHILLTVSVGIAFTDQNGVPFEDLYRKADEALYVSKSRGKNRVTLCSQPVLRKAAK